jgi:hypothetical protein
MVIKNSMAKTKKNCYLPVRLREASQTLIFFDTMEFEMKCVGLIKMSLKTFLIDYEPV